MANRHLARSIVLQTLFEWDFRHKPPTEAQEILKRNVAEFAPGVGDSSFMEGLLKSILKKQSALDTIITKAAPEWPLDKISIIDRNALRVGLYELLFADRAEVPAKVAINEAIELAKTFSGESSGKFVNGVLGAVYRELGEPGKGEGAKRKAPADSIDLSKLPVERLGGAVVYAEHNDSLYLAFVHDIFGHWTLSKGKLEGDERAEDGTKREIKEEIGLTIELRGKIGTNEYIANDPERGKIRKQVTYFLAEAPYGKLTRGSSGGLDDARWFPMRDVLTLNMYDDIIPLVTKGIKLLAKKHKT
ncbi:MAG: transcription antitermination factor NusB [Parcubacteria group bacterium]|nr:transcription antitermination factor NusB [Parcubacteria group bacterium]